ncbi:hypothetical protein ACJMK2_005649 [Sinanodonta woodiana]|uniref:Peptidase M12B domain-containing protein n=1 Tax=Sinanodonta woodiana TaxID=1069815 RepID=A0ABD3VSB8_SINWO
MKFVIFASAVCLVGSMPFNQNENSRKVDVRYIRHEGEGLRTKRESEMSLKKIFEIDVNETTVTLDLELNELVNEAAPMYVLEYGKLTTWDNPTTDETLGFYQDRNNQASMLVRCKEDLCKPIGTFTVHGQRYHLDLEGKSIESTSLLTPVENPPKVNISRNGDMIAVTLDTASADSQILTEVYSQLNSNDSVVPDTYSSQRVSANDNDILSGTDIVEIMVYTDEVICKRFIALENNDKNEGLRVLRNYYALLVNEMDTIYQSFRTHPSNTAGLDIRLFLTGIVIACDFAAAPWSHDSGHSFYDALDLAAWQENQKKQYNFTYDIAMGISAKMKFHDLGVAFTGSICNNREGVNIIYENVSSSWLMTTAVHELGHNLGAAHDQNVNCPAGYLMSDIATSGTESTAKTQYEFSTCSVTQIQSTLTSLGSNRCTLKNTFNGTQYKGFRAGAIGGEVFTADYQCQLYYGAGSYACSKNSQTMCFSGIYCQTFTGCNGKMELVKERTECDTNKWCVRGQCVDKTTSASDAPSDCFLYKTCRQVGSEMMGDGCCQGSVTTDCCVSGSLTNSCIIQVRCS